MHRQNIIAVGLLVGASAFVVTAGCATGRGPLGVLTACATRLTGGSSEVIPSNTSVSKANSPTAPEFAPGIWINSEQLTLKSLRGRVVLVDFWTFGCYNCRNTCYPDDLACDRAE